jgi:polyisoprenoid-binding protein YceI
MSAIAVAANTPLTPDAISDWRIVQDKSQVTFSARHYLLWTLQGVSHELDGVVRLNEADPRFTHVDVRIPVESFTTGRTWQDRQLLSPSVLDGEVFREIAFHGHWLRGDPRREFALDGELRLRGVAREITLNVKARDHHVDARSRTEHATYHATTVLDRRDFWHAPPVAGRAVLGDMIKISLELTLSRR